MLTSKFGCRGNAAASAHNAIVENTLHADLLLRLVHIHGGELQVVVRRDSLNARILPLSQRSPQPAAGECSRVRTESHTKGVAEQI